MAVAGMSFYAASGDDGSSDCAPASGITGLQVDDPAVQPYATGVGGTNLNASAARRDRLGRPRPVGRRRWRRRLALVHDAVVAEGPGRDPQRPVEQDQVRRQDALLPRGARRRVRRRSEHRLRHQLRRTAAQRLGRRRRHVGGGAAHGRVHGRREPLQPPQRRAAHGLRQPVPVPRVHGRPGRCSTTSRRATTTSSARHRRIPAGTGYDLATRPRLGRREPDGHRPRGLHALGGQGARHQDHRGGERQPGHGRALRRSWRAS